MGEFIALTSYDSGLPIYIRASAVSKMCVTPRVRGIATYVFTCNESTTVTETPEQIFQMMRELEEIRAKQRGGTAPC